MSSHRLLGGFHCPWEVRSSSSRRFSNSPADLGSQRERLLVLSNTNEAAEELHVEESLQVVPAERHFRQADWEGTGREPATRRKLLLREEARRTRILLAQRHRLRSPACQCGTLGTGNITCETRPFRRTDRPLGGSSARRAAFDVSHHQTAKSATPCVVR